MEICHAAGLYQIDLLNGSKNHVTEREYWAQKKRQLALDQENATLTEQDLTVKQTKFETDKEKLRKQIRSILSSAVSYEDFAEKLLELGITVKESRGRMSYLTPDRGKPITARKLGDDFDKATVLAALDQNAQRTVIKPAIHQKSATEPTQKFITMEQRVQNATQLSRMVDIEAKKAEGKGKGYEHWAKIHNLKNASRAYLQFKEMGFSFPEELADAYEAAHTHMTNVLTELKSVEKDIADKKELQRHVLNYYKTKDVREGLKACKNVKARQAYREAHESDFIILDAAKRYFDSRGLKKLPSHKALQTDIEGLIQKKNKLYNEYHAAKKEDKKLGTIHHNIQQILHGAPSKRKEQEQEI